MACASPTPPGVYESILGTRVLLAVPSGFAVAQRFTGLISEDGVSSVIVTEIEEPVDDVTDKMNEREFAARGMTWIGSEDVTIDDYDGLFVSAREPSETGPERLRWIAVFGRPDSGVMISASTANWAAPQLQKTLRDVLMTAQWNPDKDVDPYVGLGFRLEETKLLKVSDRLPSMVSFTVGGHRGHLSPGAPLYLAGTGQVQHGVSDLEVFGRQRLLEIPEIEDVEIVSSRIFELDGSPAHELVADVIDRPTDLLLRFHQTVVVTGKRYYLLQGMVDATNADEIVPHFRRISASFRHTQ